MQSPAPYSRLPDFLAFQNTASVALYPCLLHSGGRSTNQTIIKFSFLPTFWRNINLYIKLIFIPGDSVIVPKPVSMLFKIKEIHKITVLMFTGFFVF